jgi:hypothetical protein
MPAVDFDLALIVAPFRMQPGLRRLPDDAHHLTPLAADSPLHAEKLAVVQAGSSRLVVAGFDPGPALEAIAQQAQREGIAAAAGAPFELTVEEDFAVLDADSGTLPWLSVCVPSHWAPEEKLGLDFLAVHAPVADGALLRAGSRQLVQLATSGEHWERHVWTISPSARHDQHPGRHAREPWPDAADPQRFANGCYFRAERQTFFPVGRGTRQAVFTIRVMLAPLPSVIDTPAKAARLHASLSSMSDAVLVYKGLAAARAPLLRWLESTR